MTRSYLGEFEQRVLLGILRCGKAATPLDVRRTLEQADGRPLSRGAFYTTLDRLEAKALVRWTTLPGAAGRDGLPQRRYVVTAAGVRALRESRKVLLALWDGLEAALGES